MSNKVPTYQDLEKQIIALKAEKKLNQFENRFSQMLKASEDMITIHKLNGEYIYYNGPTCYSIKSEEVVGKKIDDLFDKEVSNKILNSFKKVQETGKSEIFEVELDWLGEKKWFSEYIYPLKNEEGKVTELVKVCRDIHERKIAEKVIEKQNKERKQQLQELALSKEKTELALKLLEKSQYSKSESSRIAKIGHWDYDINLDTFIFSDYIYQIYGLEVLDKIPPREKLVELYDKESQKKIVRASKKLTISGEPYDIELKLINFKEQELWVRMVVQPVFNKQNKIIGKRGVLQDISETKKTQIALQISQKKIKNSLELLRNNETALHEVSSMAKIGYWSYDIEKAKIIWSDYHHKIFGINPKEGIPSREKLLSYFDLKSQKMIEEANQKLNSKGTAYDIEVRLINEKKKEVWVRNVVLPVYDEENKFIGRRGLLQDITTFKKAQIKLELSKQEIQIALNNIEKKEHALKEATKIGKIGFIEYNNSNDVYFWSEYAYKIFGFDPKKGIPAQKDVAALLDNESKIKLKKVIEDLSLKGIGADIELKGVNKKNKEIWIRQISQPIFNDDNKIIGRKALLQNITSYKQSQIDLELSNHKIKTTLDLLEQSEYSKNEASKMAKIGYLEDDIATETYIWSDYLYEIFEFDPKKPVPSRQVITQLFDSISQNKMKEATFNLDNKGISFDLELKMINVRKEAVWIRIVVEPIYDSQNKIIKRRGVVQDITEAKNIQLELEQSEYSKNEASKIAKIGYWEIDSINNTSVWSDYIHTILGTNPEDGIPEREEIIKYLTKNSLERLLIATKNLISKGTSYDIEVKFINKNKEVFWVRNVAQPVYDDKNKVIGRRGVLQNITESKIAQQELQKSKQKVEESLNLLEKSKYSMDEASKVAKIGYFEYYIATDSFVWSDYLYEINGFDPKKPVPSREEFIPLIDKESLQTLKQATINLNTKGIPYDIEMKIFNKIKNKYIWVRNVAQPIYNDKNEIIGRRGVTQDITSNKTGQLELEKSKHTIQESLEQLAKRKFSMDEASKVAKIGYWEHELISESVIWSDYMHEILGSNIENGIPDQNGIMQNYSKESHKIFEKATKDLLFKGQSYDIILQYNHPKKGEVWVRSVAQPIYSKQNKIIGKRGVLQDITDAKIAQKELDLKNDELFELNNTLNEAQKLSHVGSWQWNMNTDEAEWSDEMYNIYGVTKENFYPSNENVTKTVLPEDLPKIEKGISSLLIDEIFIPFEFRILRPTGEIRYLYIMALEKNSGDSIFGVTKDITERKKIEIENLRIQDNYKRLFNNASTSIWNEDFTLIIKEINKLRKLDISNIRLYIENRPQLLLKILGKIKVNKINRATLKLFEVESSEKFLDNLQDTFGTGAEKVFGKLIESIWNNDKIFTSEVNYKTLKGNEFAAIVSIPIPQSEMEQKTVPVSIQSIQSIKEAESEKKESLRKLKETQELARLGSWVFNFSNLQSDWSDETFRIWGINPELGIPDFDTFISKIDINDREAFLKAANLATTKGAPYNIEFRIHLANGDQKWVRSICKPVFGSSGELINLTGSNQDITEQKLRQEELDTQNEKLFDLNSSLNNAQKIAKLGSWFFYPSTETEEWSEEMFHIWGYDPNKGIPNNKKVLSRIHPEDLESFKKVDNRSINEGISYNIEFRIILPNNIIKTINSICKPVFGDDGKVISLAGTNQDITEKKLISIQIEKAEKMYRLLADNSNDLICLHEPDSTFKYISPSIKDILGYEQAEKIGELGFSLIYKDDVQLFRDSIFQRIYKQVPNTTFYCRAKHKKGEILWLEFSTSAVFKNNKPDYILTSSRDVTDWMLAKQEIQEYQISLQEMTTEMTLIEEKQKKEIASNIHDHLSQSLVISKMKINQLKKNPELKIIDKDLNFIDTHISEALENSRKITYELSPPVLYQLGIIDALNWLLENVEATHNIECKIHSNISSIKLSDVKSILLYRCIQEVIKNAVKYANSTLLTLELNKNDFGINIRFSDNGDGFDTKMLNNYKNHSGSGFGLFAVQERIRNIQGEFAITSKLNIGTSVNIFIPLSI